MLQAQQTAETTKDKKVKLSMLKGSVSAIKGIEYVSSLNDVIHPRV